MAEIVTTDEEMQARRVLHRLRDEHWFQFVPGAPLDTYICLVCGKTEQHRPPGC